MFLLLLSITFANDIDDIFAIDNIIFKPGSDLEQAECATEKSTKDSLLMCKKDINKLLYEMKLIINSLDKDGKNATK